MDNEKTFPAKLQAVINAVNEVITADEITNGKEDRNLLKFSRFRHFVQALKANYINNNK